MITKEQVTLALREQFPGALLDISEPYGMLTIEVPREQVYKMLLFLKDHDALQFNFLTTACGLHYPDNKGKELGMMYQLHSWVNNYRLRIKTFFPIEDPTVDTLTPIWPAANWMEREAFDFFGIIANNHPNLTRILNVEDLDVFPMRKEYRLEDGTRTDKDDRFFGRDGNTKQRFE